jgi:diaminopimelate epimerase
MLTFTKMHGLGNDFVIIDAINQSVDLSTSQIRFLADRHFGIGCDQLLLVEKPTSGLADFRYRIFNADGGEVSQCGNGARCFARFVYDRGLTDKTHIAVETASGIIYPEIKSADLVAVDMGQPVFEPQAVPFKAEQQAITYNIQLDNGQQLQVGVVSMGNPHAVTLVEDVALADVVSLGPLVESHQDFPARVNAGFMQVIDEKTVKLRVFERGVGETLACGTGACAAVVVGIQQGLLARRVRVMLPGGDLDITWNDDNASVWMTGSATHVFDGEIPWAIVNSK